MQNFSSFGFLGWDLSDGKKTNLPTGQEGVLKCVVGMYETQHLSIAQ